MASARVEGLTEGHDALAVAKRELAAVLPLLKPTRKLFAEVANYHEPEADAQLERLLVLSSLEPGTFLEAV